MSHGDSTPLAHSPLPRLVFLDNLRYLMVLLVIVHHAVAAYAATATHWQVHDTPFLAADVIRQLLDVFMMPVLFFIAGYLALPSLERKGPWGFLVGKGRRLLVPWALAVLVFVPIMLYDQPSQTVRPFRSFYPLSLLIVLVSAGARYWNHAGRLGRALSGASYDIYLTHVWFVVFVQMGLLEWAAGPALLKFAIVVALAMPLSFAFGRWVLGRHGRIFAAVLVALLIFCLAVRP
jgi:surface polysaccharide O-acyltransferase-like enzyme